MTIVIYILYKHASGVSIPKTLGASPLKGLNTVQIILIVGGGILFVILVVVGVIIYKRKSSGNDARKAVKSVEV